jgi:clan AA aspartic protease (TIGR02281 family)
MILDTGATYTSISWSVALDIGDDPAVSPRRVSTITANGIIELPLITVDRMEIEGLEAENIDVTCQDIPELAGVEGLLGLSFLERFRSVIDYKSGFLEID